MTLWLRSGVLIPAMMVAFLTLSGCESTEEKAERYFQSGLALMAAGDEERALVEFRNVFKYNGFHKEARTTYAGILQARGEVTEAYAQYLRYIEQYPDSPDVRLILAVIAISRSDWPEAERHGEAALALAPDMPGVRAIRIALDYRAAVLARDDAARTLQANAARDLLVTLPDNTVARRVVIDHLVNSPVPTEALPVIDAALKIDPASLEFHMLKFRLLAQAEDVPGTGTQLQQMFTLFPENEQIRTALIGWYLVQKDLDGAEAFLRRLAGADDADPKGHIGVIEFLRVARGIEPARAELIRLRAATAGGPNAALYTALSGVLDFEEGQQGRAIASLHAIVDKAEPSDQTRRIMGMLALMQDQSGNRDGARALVEAVLKQDPGQVDTLKLRAAWAIEEDRPAQAIVDLRTALGQAPRDPAILTLMAQAHERDGALDLAGERLALAVEVSGSAPDEALRYAGFLNTQGRGSVAETVLVDALRVSPAHPGLLATLAELYLQKQNWTRAQAMIGDLRDLGQPETESLAQTLQAAVLLGQNRAEDSLAFLETLAAGSVGKIRAVAMVVQSRIRNGKPEEARKLLDEALAETPADPTLRGLSGSLYALTGATGQAEAIYRALIADHPGQELPVQLLHGLLNAAGRTQEARGVLQDGLARQPSSTPLRWMLAGEMERAGDFEAAITIYEQIYAKDSGNPVVANNLASLIATHRSDATGLERAFAIARRLRGVAVPAFQDTYGWIEYRRGNLDEALSHLQPAAAGLPGDALVQFHYGMVLADLGRDADAMTQFKAALSLAGDSPLPQFAQGRAKLAELQARQGQTKP